MAGAFEDLLLTADRAVGDRLGRDVLYTPEVGAPVTVRGVFDAAYLTATPGEPGVATARPALFLDVVDLGVDPVRDNPTITIAGVNYEVREVQPDGAGVGVLLLLSRIT